MAGGPEPLEVEMYHAVRRYGAQAVIGRTLGVNEVRLMDYIENTIRKLRAQNNG